MDKILINKAYDYVVVDRFSETRVSGIVTKLTAFCRVAAIKLTPDLHF